MFRSMPVAPAPDPVASESNAFRITFAPLSLEEVYALADDPANGAVVVMRGKIPGFYLGRSQHLLVMA